MEIAEAFTEEAIAVTGATVGDEKEDELRQVIAQIYNANEMDVPDRNAENIAVLCFVAGRAYGMDEGTIPVHMSRELAGEFMEFLQQRGAP
jgi:hypothetical protein